MRVAYNQIYEIRYCYWNLMLLVLIYTRPFVMSQNCEMRGCQWFRNGSAFQKLKKFNCAFCAALLVVEKIFALLMQCYLCPPLNRTGFH